jgi:hypothetical protein
MEELEQTQAEAIDRAIGAEMHASLCGVLAWLLLIPHVLIAVVCFVDAFFGDGGESYFVFGLLSLFSGALLYMTPMVFKHVLEMKATSLKLQVDAMPD